MSFPSTTLLLSLWLSSAIAYKLPLLSLFTHDDKAIHKPNNSPFGINYKWEWQLQARMDEGNLKLGRLRRDIIDKKTNKGDIKQDEKKLPKVEPTEPIPKKDVKQDEKNLPQVKPTEPPPKKDVKQDEKFLPKVKPTEPLLEEFTDSTPYILEAFSTAHTKAKMLPILKDETTPLVVLQETAKGTEETLDEDETTTLTDQEQTSKDAKREHDKYETTHAGKSIPQSRTLTPELTLNPTTSEKLSVLTSNINNQVHTTNSQDTGSKQTSPNDILMKGITSSSSLKPPETSPTSKSHISHDFTTGHDVTTVGLSSSSSKPVAVTYITTSLEEKIHTQSIMKQCMLTILILAIVCTIFIISTIALAAKLSTMKQKNKLRHPITYTEMRCISSLLPDSDQQNKPQPKRLKTFTSTMEESDGDNTTLHSFLPDH